MVRFLLSVALLLLLFPSPAYATTVLKSFIPESLHDPRSNFDIDLYYAVMDATVEEFGPYKIELIPRNASQNRDLEEVARGELVNVDIVAARQEWEERTIPIRIPLLKGMLGIRLFLARRDAQDQFETIRTLEELKQLRVGSEESWTITGALKALGFNVVTGTDYDGMFMMLDYDRFDLFPRGINEIFLELEKRLANYPDLVIEPNLALEIPLPTFFFVSPNARELAARIRLGLEKMIGDGSYDKLFSKYYADTMKRADLQRRRLFRVDNPTLTRETRDSLGAPVQ